LDTKYEFNLQKIDERIKDFPVIQSLVIFPNKPKYRFFEGVSQLFKKSWRKKGTEGTGFFANGSIEGWKLPQLLFQLIFCINDDICPFNTQWSAHRSIKNRWNFGKVIMNALTSILELHFCLRMKVMTKSAIESLHEVIRNARAHLALLWIMRNDLNNLLKALSQEKAHTGIKDHYVIHLTYQLKMRLHFENVAKSISDGRNPHGNG
jgi:hypothetical protein